jgi:hypothetical protein
MGDSKEQPKGTHIQEEDVESMAVVPSNPTKLIDESLVAEIAEYLSHQKYREVYMLIEKLRVLANR